MEGWKGSDSAVRIGSGGGSGIHASLYKKKEDDDINNLPVGEAIVSAPSGEPFRFKFNLYQ